MALCLHHLQLYSQCSLFWLAGVFFFRILWTVFPSVTLFRGNNPFVFLSGHSMAEDNLLVLIGLSNCTTSLFTSHFFCFRCLIWRALTSKKISSSRPCFHKIMRLLRVLEFDPFVSDLVLGSSRCGRIIAAFIATLEFCVSSTNDNSC